MERKALISTIVCGVVGVVILLVGIVMIPVFKNLIHNKIKETIPIDPKSDLYKDFLSPPTPIYFQIWLFDVVNHDEVLQNGDKPALIQKGPYTYREERLKVNVTFNDNGTVSYKENRWYVFEEEKSAGPETQNITTLNIPIAIIDNLVKGQFSWIRELVNLLYAVTDEEFFIKLSVKELMWGYEDPLLKEAVQILRDLHINYTLNDHFGLFMGQNGSDDGLYTVFTGKGDTSKHAIIDKWNGMSKLPYWTSVPASMINGTDGTMYPPFVSKTDPIYIFSSDVCRSLYADFEYDYDLKGIQLYRFVAPPSVFLNATANPDNKGFCTKAEGCLPSGVVDVSACRSSAPIILSQPHFLDAAPSIQNSVYGLHPNRKEHQTLVDLEPMTGTVMNAAKKLQINIHIMNVSFITETSNIKSMFLPILWLNESAIIDDKSAQTFRDKVQEPIKLTQAIQFGVIAVGIFIIVCVMVFTMKNKFCSLTTGEAKDMEPIINAGATTCQDVE